MADMVELGSLEFWELLRHNPTYLAAQVCSVDVARLDETLQRHPALRAWVNAAHESARIGEERQRWEVTKARARALLIAKNQPDVVTGKPKTVQVIEAEVETDDAVQKSTGDLLALQEQRAALRAMADALEDRLQMLIQISAKQRVEMKESNR